MTPFTQDDHEPLAPVDATWYRLDRRGLSLDIGALLLFEEPLEFDALRRLVEDRLLVWRRFRQLVVDRPAQVGVPRWRDAPDFRLDAHLHHLAVPRPGDDRALAELAGDLMSSPLDLNRPLWEMYLLDRAGGRSAVLARVHHCIGDGFALGHLLLSLGTPQHGEWNGGQKRGDGEKQSWFRQLGGLLAHPGQAVDQARQAGRTARALGHLVMLPFDTETVLRRPVSQVRRAAWSKPLELTWIKQIGKHRDATVNDVLMTAMSGALRTHLLEEGEPVGDLELKAVMPVNLRSARFIEEMPDELGNHFGLVFVKLPVDEPTADERLREMKRTIDRLKQSPEPVVALGLLQTLGYTPAFFEHLIEDIFVRKASLVATNVPGPRQPLYFAGRRLEDVLFWVPHPGHLGLGMSIMSYAGRVRIGIRSDAEVVAAPNRLAERFTEQVEKMEK